MLHDDHVFSDNLTEEELEKLLADLDTEESGGAKVSSAVEPTLEQRLSSAVQSKSNKHHKALSGSYESEDWIAKLLEDEETVAATLDESITDDKSVNDADLQAMVAEINQNIANKKPDSTIEFIDDLDVETEIHEKSITKSNTKADSIKPQLLEDDVLAIEIENVAETSKSIETDILDIELLDEADLAIESTQTSISNSKIADNINQRTEPNIQEQESLIQDDLLLDDVLEDFEFNEELLIEDEHQENPDDIFSDIDIIDQQSSEAVSENGQVNTEKTAQSTISNVHIQKELTDKVASDEIASDYDVDSFLDTSLLENSSSDDKVEENTESSISTVEETELAEKTSALNSKISSIDSDDKVVSKKQIDNISEDSSPSITKISPHLDEILQTEKHDSKQLNIDSETSQGTQIVNSHEDIAEGSKVTELNRSDKISNIPEFLKQSVRSQDAVSVIQSQVKEMKVQVRHLQDTFRALTDLSAEMIAETRQLQNMCKDDFSVTYEQMHEFRNLILKTCRDIDGTPSMLGVVEEALESDLYVAETRKV